MERPKVLLSKGTYARGSDLWRNIAQWKNRLFRNVAAGMRLTKVDPARRILVTKQ